MNKEEVKYKAIKKVGYGECFSDNINYIIENVDRWCGPVFDVYVDGVKVDNPKQYLEDHKPKEPQTLEEKIVDMCYKIDHLKEENKQLKEVLIELKGKILGLLLKIDEQDFLVSEEELEKLLQILDKVKKVK